MKIAFLGDSITEGCFEIFATPNGENILDTYRDPESVYHTRLKTLLHSKKNLDAEIINAGKSGDNAEGGAKRVLPDVIQKSPDLSVVCFGLNDVCTLSLDGYLASLRSIFSALRNAEIPFIFMTPNQMNSYVHPNTLDVAKNIATMTAKFQNEGKMDEYMKAAVETAVSCGGKICDVYAEWKRMEHLGVDTTMLLANYINHPIRNMHLLFAEKLYDTIFSL